MKLVLNSPVGTNRFGHFCRREVARGNVVALLHAERLAFDLTHRVNARDDRTFRPIAFRHDAARRQHRAALGNESAMPLFRLLDMDDLILAVKESILNRLVQPGLVTFDRQQVIGLPGNDLLGNRPLAAHGVNTDEEAFQVQGIEQFGNGRDLVALRRHFLLTKYQTQPGRKGADHVNGRFAAVAGTAHGFAVDRDGLRP